MTRVLLLGGTSEASELACALAACGQDAVFSYAGRTAAPVEQPLETRVGGFGGVDGLRAYLRKERITHVVDATHPFAATMSRNAFAACEMSGVDLIRFERPAWVPGRGDNWQSFALIEDIPAALPDRSANVFLAIGKQQIGVFATRPEHRYLLRFVDRPTGPLPLKHSHVVVARGPFDAQQDLDLLKEHQITHVVAKNSGGTGARAKLDAARLLGLPVLMVSRPNLPGKQVADDVAAVLGWLGHKADLGV